MKQQKFDVIVIGSGAAGMMSAITSARGNNRVVLIEKLSNIASKLKATGGGRCNLTNTLSNEDFIEHFGANGRFMRDALLQFNHENLMEFFLQIGVSTHAPDGYRVFPTSHQSTTIITALYKEMKKLNIEILCSCEAKEILFDEKEVRGADTTLGNFFAPNVIIATGGLGYPVLGAHGDGYRFAKSAGHKITQLSPAMMPLVTEERWVENCRADTISKVEIRVDLPKAKKLRAKGDLIFTKNGIRGPVVLDFARFVTPLLESCKKVPILLNLTKGMNEEEIVGHFKNEAKQNPERSILEQINTLLPLAISKELCLQAGINETCKYSKVEGFKRDKLIKLLAWMPLNVVGHDGFEKAMITRGGVSLKEINPKTMQSRLIKGLYFCGEVVDLDGPCGGYNLQWSFSGGYLAGCLK